MEDENKIIIIIASSAVLILCVLVICIIIIILCRRKRANTKYNSPLEMEEREKPDGYAPDSSNQKWPLRPGLLVPGHKLQNINIIHSDRETSPFKTTSVARKLNQSKYAKNRPKVYAQLERFKTFMGFNGYDYVPSGLTYRSSGVVTFKKSATSLEELPSTIMSRKRKKPGAVPNQSSIGDKTGLGAAPPLGGIADPSYDHDKGFYENLPFHSMQNPPNKPISVIAPFHQGQTSNNPLSDSFPHKQSVPNCSTKSLNSIAVKRHQSFSGFPRTVQTAFNQNSPINVFNSQYFNFHYPSLPKNNSLFRTNSSQYFPNRPEFRNIFNNVPPSFQYQPGRCSSSSFPVSKPMSLLNLSLPNTRSVENQIPTSKERTYKAQGKNSSEKSRAVESESKERVKEVRFKEGTITKRIADTHTIEKRSDAQSDSELRNELSDSPKKHSPTFYSLRYKKNSKTRHLVQEVPKRVFSDGDLSICQDSGVPDMDKIKDYRIVPIPAPRYKKPKKRETIYQSSDEIHSTNPLLEISIISTDLCSETKTETATSPEIEEQVPPKFEEKATEDQVDSDSQKIPEKIVSPGVSSPSTNSFKSHSVDTRPKLVAVSPKKAALVSSNFKRSPTVRVSPHLKPQGGIQKGALSIQIQAKIKGSSSQNPPTSPNVQRMKPDQEKPKTSPSTKTKDVPKNSPNPKNNSTSKDNSRKLFNLSEVTNSPTKIPPPSLNASSQNTSTSISDTEVPQMPILDTSENKWSPKFNHSNRQNAFYTLTAPHHKPPSMDLASHYSATIPHPKHTKLISRALFQEQQLPKSKSFSSKSKQKKHFQIPLQKCHSFKFQTAESYFQPIKSLHEENLMKNGYVSDYADTNRVVRSNNKREKHKQKTNGPLVVMRQNDYQDSLNFQENVQSSVHLQYPQPGLNSPLKPQTGRPNGLVYADLDMPKPGRKISSANLSKSKQQKNKPKTEYATLQFNDVGQEIDV